MTFKADTRVMLRFPVLPAETLDRLAATPRAELDAQVRRYLQDPYVREAIYLASPALHRRVRDWESGEGGGDIALAVARYLLRMGFRSTPFGTFAAVSSFPVRAGAALPQLPGRDELRRDVQLDASALARLVQRALRDPAVREVLPFHPNDTIHRSDEALAYISYERNRRGRRVYRRIEVERSVHLDAALELAAAGDTVAVLADRLAQRFPADGLEAARGFVEELVESQLLCCDQLVDITRHRSLEALLQAAPASTAAHREAQALDTATTALCNTQPIEADTAYGALVEQLAAAGVQSDRQLPVKVDLYADGAAAQALPAVLVAALETAVGRVVELRREAGSLSDFTRRFTERYGDASVPLTVVSEELDALGFSGRLSSLPALSRMVRDGSPVQRSSARTLLDSVAALVLQQPELPRYLDISALVDSQPAPAAPREDAAVVAWFSLWQGAQPGEPVIELRSIGAQEPGRVMGRFAHGLPELAQYLRATEAQRPVVELVHQPEDRLGNISARPALSRYELRLRGGVSEQAECLALDDLSVSVSGGRVVLWSRRLGGAIDLRMSNAHAYDRQGSLPLYRFLNQVSVQAPVAEALSLRRKFPKAPFAPGLKYRGVIVSRATWLLTAAETAALHKLAAAPRREALRVLREARRLPDWVAWVERDHVIPFHLDTDWMVDELLKAVRKQGQVLLTEAAPEQRQPALTSAAGAHFHEFQIALRAQAAQRAAVHVPASHRGAVEPLWGQWAYLRLYVSPHLQARVLQELGERLEPLRAAGAVDDYFLVRYVDDGGPHLRLRCLARAGAAAERTLAGLRPLLDSLSAKGLLHDLQMGTYLREVSRYGGPARMTVCERIFGADTRAVLRALPLVDPDEATFWREAAVAADQMLAALGLASVESRLPFARRAAADFAAEAQFNSLERKKIGEIFAASRPIRLAGHADDETPDTRSGAVFRASVADIAALWCEFVNAEGSPVADLYPVRWALVHMRMNRLLDRDQRLQEAVIWELLKRSYARVLARGAATV